MGAYEGMAGRMNRTLGSRRRVQPIFIPVRGNQPAIRGFFPGCYPKVRCGVAILGGAFLLNDFSLFFVFEALAFADSSLFE